jgi:hypothetical protein
MIERRSPGQEGMSLYAGSVSSDGVPAGCRAVALRTNRELTSVTIYLPMATSHEVVANIAATKRLAIVATYPPDHFAVQLKGTTTAVRLAADDESEFVHSRLGSLGDVLHGIGIPRRVTGSINCWPAFAVEMKVDELFEQTPGPKAGTPIR